MRERTKQWSSAHERKRMLFRACCGIGRFLESRIKK